MIRRIWGTPLVAVALLAGAMLAAGCSSSKGGGGGSAPGVTSGKIVLGNLTDLSGVFAPIGKEYLAGAQMFVSTKNQQGGVCGRQLSLLVGDHGYNAQRAATLYTQMEPKILGLEAVLGTGMTSAILPRAVQDHVLLSPIAWNGLLLQSDAAVLQPGPTYVVSSANAVAWAIEQYKVKPGETVGMIVFKGDIGNDYKHGIDIAASKAGVKVVAQYIAPTDTDFTGPVTALKNANAKVVLLGTTASQFSTILSTATSLGYDPLQWVSGSTGSFTPSLLNGPAKQTLETKVAFATPGAVWGEDTPAVQAVHEAYQKLRPNVTPGFGMVLGYGQAQAYVQVIASTCKNLTRQAIIDKFRSLHTLDTGGLVLTLDLTRGAGKSQTLQGYMVRPDSSVPGGLKRITPNFTSPAVAASGL